MAHRTRASQPLGIAALALVAALAAAATARASAAQTEGVFAQEIYAVEGGPNAIAIGDLDRDGDPDVVSASPYANVVTVRLGADGERFGPAAHFAVGVGFAG